MEDYKQAIIDNLMAMRSIEVAAKATFKARAYDKVIKQLKEVQGPIKSMEDLAAFKGIGDGIKEKLAKIFEHGFLNSAAEALKNVEKEKLIEELTTVMAIGPVKARDLVEQHNISSIAALKEHTELLNEKQKLGLHYHGDFVERIPRKEMDKHDEFIKAAILPNMEYAITGSYRRHLPSSGDIDVLITCDDITCFHTFIQSLKDKKYLKEEFAHGNEKYLGIARLPRYKTHRRIDIMVIPRDKFAFALLYFTGSQSFNIKMRNVALEKGYSLSEHGLKYAQGPNKGKFYTDTQFKTEQDVFEFLGMDYVEPKSRK